MDRYLSGRPARAVAVGLAAIVVLAIAARLVAGPPRYRACVAALEQVTAGMPWVEAERHLADAVAAGGDRDDGVRGPPLPMELVPLYSGPEPDTTWVTCYRNGNAVAEPRRFLIGSVWVWLVGIAPDLNAVPFAPADYTWLQVARRDEEVVRKRLLDCLGIHVLDNYGGSPYDRPGCRPHSPADE